MSLLKSFISLLVLGALSIPSAQAWNNAHLVDYDKNGFVLYRTGAGKAEEMKQWCDRGVTEMMVLSGDAADYELKYQKYCPTLKVIYNTKQSARDAVSAEFLRFFDSWIADAKAHGKKIAFRCDCGCHRTGRLAAYYRMKYNGWNADQAEEEMDDLGKYMFLFPGLDNQVRAMYNYLNGEECDEKPKFCVQS